MRLARRRPLVRRASYRIVDWDEVPSLFTTTEMAAEAARLRGLHPSDVAAAVRSLPLAQRRQLAEMMEDDRLADLLEELPEAEQLGMIEGLDLERLLSVLEEMEVDDLADLLAEMPGERGPNSSSAMDVEDADVLRRLLSYEEGTAGSLMTPDIIIFGPHATVAEALAEVRDPDWLVSIAAQVFVTNAPFVAPTGTYLGVVHFQRLLREPPSMKLGRCLEEEPTVPPDMPEREVAERLASYNLMAVAVCDEQRRLLGAITVDDVLDRTLPADWRQRRTQRGDGMRGRGEDLSRPRKDRRGLGIHYDTDAFGRVQRGHRPLPRHRPLPGVPDRAHRRVDRAQHLRARQPALRPVRPWTRPAHPGPLAAGVLRRAADPAGAEPPGAPGPLAVRHRPPGGRAHPVRHRVPRPGVGQRPVGARRHGHHRKTSTIGCSG